ncbi:hypothetical protein DL771_006612 [Monosporascus sp. 5C6A]|nr:hypothetical protein DL771_006612 [Monosporascus sp. 5C6A]
MRLINTISYEFKDFSDNAPLYAILSHRWEEEEVTYEDMLQGKRFAGKKAGFSKNSGPLSPSKASSSELSEAINSMFQWYKNSSVCYVYLREVSSMSSLPSTEIGPDGLHRLLRESVRSSKWFTRGWTLQELLAPRRVEFYAHDWSEIGTKRSLAHTISDVTLIDCDILQGGASVRSVSLAERMRWASMRETTRGEDMAYCLLGIFGVNMPLLYGEGRERAFLRLQEEIMKMQEDYTLLA